MPAFMFQYPELADNDEQEECSSCGFQTRRLKYFSHPMPGRSGGFFCWLCAYSGASNAYFYPTHYRDGKAQAVACFVGNAVLGVLSTITP